MSEPAAPASFAGRTRELMTKIRETPVARQLIPLEAGVGWPLPSRRDGRVYVTLPFFGRARDPERRGTWQLRPPFATITIDVQSGKIVGYRHLGYDRLWEPVDGSVGTFPHSPQTADKARYSERRAELLGMYDEMFAKLRDGETFAPEWVARLAELLGELMEPSLVPFYRLLAPKFIDRFLGVAPP